MVVIKITTVRSAKNKGSQFEINCQHSLKSLCQDIMRMGGEGQYLQFDLKTDDYHAVFECKRLKSISWNQCVKFYDKLVEMSPVGYDCYLLFKSNNQPCLVFTKSKTLGVYTIAQFEDVFETPFIKHESTRAKK